MDNQELIQCFTDIVKEKKIDRTEISSIIEELFKTLIEKEYGCADNCEVIVNIDRGEIEVYQEKTIVELVDDPFTEISLDKAQKIEPDLQLGETFIEVVQPQLFGRRLVANAKQFLAQKIKDIEKRNTFDDYIGRVGEIVIGDIRQTHRDNLYIHIDQSELRMPREDQIENERFRRGDSVRAIIKSVEMTAKGPDIVVSRSDEKFLAKLFEMEVPEIEDGIIEILSISRAPGVRAKIIVQSHDRRIDAVGACVGMRGSRIQAVVRELNGEKIDVVNYSSQPEVLISRALSPAKPFNLYIDDERMYCVAVFDDEEMESGVGKSYQNIRLASNVTGYNIEAFRQSEYEGAKSDETFFLGQIETLTERMVELMSQAGVETVSDFRSASREDMLAVKGVGEKMIDTISTKIDTHLESLMTPEEEDTQEEEEETLSHAGDSENDLPTSDIEGKEKTDTALTEAEAV